MLAAVACTWFVLAGFFGARHESTVAHVVDLRTGELCHADAMVGAHTSGHSDYHDRAEHDSDHDACAISAVMHQAARADFAWPTVGTIARLELCSAMLAEPRLARVAAVYRIAPKTSPPSRA